jgi:translation initiation factor 2-alpha kinase 4
MVERQQMAERTKSQIPQIHFQNENTSSEDSDFSDELGVFTLQDRKAKTPRKRSKSFANVYQKHQLLYQGKTGSIYHGVNIQTKSELAIKEIPLPIPLFVSAHVEIQVNTEEITQVIESLKTIQNPFLACYYGSRVEKDGNHTSLLIYRHLVPGESLHEYLKKHGPITSEEKLAKHLAQVLAGCVYLHHHNVSHQALNPQNIIFDHCGNLVLTDFGLESTLLLTHHLQEENQLYSRFQQDIWNIGAMLIHMISGGKTSLFGTYDPSLLNNNMPKNLTDEAKEFIFTAMKTGCGSVDDLVISPFITKNLSSDDNPFLNNSSEYLIKFPDAGDELLISIGEDFQRVHSNSRYLNDFVELEFVGRGGFGEVVKAKNILDNRVYAIKKVPLEENNLQNKKILREVTTFARLYHQYVVRYYQAWIETSLADKADSEGHSSKNAKTKRTKSRGASNSFNSLKLSTNTSLFMGDEEEEEEEEEEVFQRVERSFEDDSSDFEPVLYDTDDDLESHFNNQFFPQGSDADRASDSDHKEASSDSWDDFEAGPSFSFGAPGTSILYIQMEYCTKKTLATLIEEAALDEDEIWKLFRQMVEGLDHIHSQDLIHRDLKPANIFLDSNNNVKIGDFGLATSGTTLIDPRLGHSDDDSGEVRNK